MSKKLQQEEPLFFEIKNLIETSKNNIAVSVNAEMTMLYWTIGKRINDEVLQNNRAEYGKQIVATLARQLETEFGRGWSEKQLRHCLRFAEVFPDMQIIYALRIQLSWTHIRMIMFMPDALKRMFYIEMCKIEKWSSRQLQERINSMLYERTAISKKPEETIKSELKLLKNDQTLTADLVFRDPYFLDFLNLNDTYSEKDLEAAILAEIQRFITEMGSDFAFLARQKRLMIDNRDYYIDLLFYHRRLKSLVAIDLKIGEFDAAHKGEMELYLGYLDKHEKVEGENQPVGLILCTGKNQEHIELMQMNKSNIKVAEYLTLLPSKEILLEKLQKAIAIAKNNIESHQ
jgi:predicted nuclease of restriction endonuclease-like (RecB) superfamily